MSWIKEANKIGKYETSYKGFRLYCTKEPEIIQSVVTIDGEQYNRTELIKGWFVAIDKTKLRFEANNIQELSFKIEVEEIRRVFSKREGEELKWQ